MPTPIAPLRGTVTVCDKWFLSSVASIYTANERIATLDISLPTAHAPFTPLPCKA